MLVGELLLDELLVEEVDEVVVDLLVEMKYAPIPAAMTRMTTIPIVAILLIANLVLLSVVFIFMFTDTRQNKSLRMEFPHVQLQDVDTIMTLTLEHLPPIRGSWV